MIVRVQSESFGKAFRMAVANAMILAGSVGVLVWAWGMLETTLYQHVQKTQFERQLSERPAEMGPRPTAQPASTGNGAALRTRAALKNPAALSGLFRRDPFVLGEIEVPRLNWDVIVREGLDDTTLRRAAGHVPATAFPGEPGNFVVLGHRDTLFRPLRGLEKGDNVRVRTAEADFSYWIDSIEVVSPEDVNLRQVAKPGITLVTCFPFDFVGPAPRRFVARGHLEAR
jgi:LPXTG-site transpeptidase (sortase) family protein